MRVVTEVAALDRSFDYAVADGHDVPAIGDRVRVDLHGRSVRGWVEDHVAADRELKVVKKWLGFGPPASLLPLAKWAGDRWYAPRSRFLLAMSPDRLVTNLPAPPPAPDLAPTIRDTATNYPSGVVRCAPNVDPLGLVLQAYLAAREVSLPLLVLVPTDAWSRRMVGRLEQRGLPAVLASRWDCARASWPIVVGARGAAFAPVAKLGAAVIIDVDDESYRSEASPTWHALDVMRHRCDHDGAPLWITSSLPSPAALQVGPLSVADDEEGLWPRLEIVDRRASDPRDGVLAANVVTAAHRALSGDSQVAVAVILQRLGRGRLFACASCGTLARCETCGAAEEEVDGRLSCGEGHGDREVFCVACGATKLRRVRSGVTTLARDVAAQLSQDVTEITASSDPAAAIGRVVVGTEAVLQRVRRCALVIFVDFDQYLLAPRERARRDAVAAVARAGRLVGGRREGRGSVILQTRRGEDAVITALASLSFESLSDDDVETAKVLGLPPYGAIAEIEGESATAFVATMDAAHVRVVPTAKGYSVHAPDPLTLSHALRSATRPAGRLRVAVS